MLLSISDKGLMAIDGILRIWSEHLFDKPLKINRFYSSMRAGALFLILLINVIVFGYSILMILSRKIQFREFRIRKKRTAIINIIRTFSILIILYLFVYSWKIYLGWAVNYIVPEYSLILYYTIIALGIFLLIISLLKFIIVK